MRILTVGNRLPGHGTGGYERVWQAAAAGLEAAGHDVALLAPPALEWYWEEHAFLRKRLDQVLRLESRNRRALDEHLKGADLVVWFAMGGMSLSLLARPRVPQLAVVHDGWPLYGPGVDQGSRRGRWPRDRVDWWSCNSRFTRDALVARAGIDAARTSVEPPGIDPAAFPPAPPRAWGGELLVLGRVEARKGVADAIAALPDGMRLTVAGPADPRHLQELQRLGRAVAFTGATTEPARAIAAADAVLFPVTWDEPWGLVPLEAMAVGRPVVATGTGGSAEYLRHEENALLVPPGEPAQLRAAAERLRDEPALRERLVAGGRETAARYSEAGWTADLVALAERVAAQPLTAR